MEYHFCMQDPTQPETTYLYEALLHAATEATAWRGIFAFVSRDGIDHLLDDPVIHAFIGRGGDIDLLVGIDAVTNRPTLERLREIAEHNPRFRPRVFWNQTQGLFHPKLSHFSYLNGRKTLILGSGNLTPGGLMHNFEGYSIISADPGEELDLSSLDCFLARHHENIRVIDDEALERAARNLVRPIQHAKASGAPTGAPPVLVPLSQPAAVGAPAFDRILIAQVPGGGGRWAQAHFNADVIANYFRITDRVSQRAYLSQVRQDGARRDEEVRPLIYSQDTNRNQKLEVAAARGLDYPNNGRPILVFRERQTRCFDYMLLMPGEPGHVELLQLTTRLPSVGRGLPRVITDLPTLTAAWPQCPLLTVETEARQEI